jgi:dinuclear metal center YbgI/SA1388 family protein
MKTKLADLIRFLEEIAPPQLQEVYDNSGLLWGDPDWYISGVIVCLDSTESIVDEAIANNCNVIVAHHPIIFEGIKKLNTTNYIHRTLVKAIKNNIAIYAIHTNLDNVLYQGVNGKIAAKLELESISCLSPSLSAEKQGEMIGAGVIGILKKEMQEKAFLQLVKDRMNVSIIRHTQLLNKPIQKVAICGGSGSFLLETAINQKADCFITADVKYHQFFDANKQILYMDIGHYESEQFTIELLYEQISKNFSKFAAHITKELTNPVFYY